MHRALCLWRSHRFTLFRFFQSFIFRSFFLSFDCPNLLPLALIQNILKIFLRISNHRVVGYENTRSFTIITHKLFSFLNIQYFSNISIFCLWIFSDSVYTIFLGNLPLPILITNFEFSQSHANCLKWRSV